jgi:hypothetical protein
MALIYAIVTYEKTRLLIYHKDLRVVNSNVHEAV